MPDEDAPNRNKATNPVPEALTPIFWVTQTQVKHLKASQQLEALRTTHHIHGIICHTK